MTNNLVIPIHNFVESNRTSLTREEAVECLLIWSRLNPPRLQPLSLRDNDNLTPEEISAYESITIFDLLDQCNENAEAEYIDAKFDQALPNVIAEKLECWERSKSLLEKAHGFLCIIDDELAKGVLRVNQNNMQLTDIPLITIQSFLEWVASNPDLPGIPVVRKTRPEKKIFRQGDAIKVELARLGYELMQLPKPRKGLGGPCAVIKARMLEMDALFPSQRTLEKAWSHLRKVRKEIAWASSQ